MKNLQTILLFAKKKYVTYNCIISSIVLLLQFCDISLFAQQKNNTDWQNQIAATQTDTAKARLKGEWAWQIKFTNQTLATTLAKEEINIGYKHNDNIRLADGYRMLGLQYVIGKKYIEGEAYYDSCIKYAQLANSDYYQASCYSFWAGMYGAHSDFDKSIALLQKGLVHAKKANDPKILAVLSNNLAENFKLSGKKSPEIAQLFQLAFDNFATAKEWKFASVVAANLAQEYADNKDVAKAKTALQQSLTYLSKDTSDVFLVAQTYNSYATIYLQLGDIVLAKTNALISKLLLEKENLPDNLLLTIETLTKICLTEKNYISAEMYAKQQLQLATQQQSKLNISNAYKALSQIEEQKGDFKQSLSYFQLYKSWQDSVYNDQKQQAITNSELKAKMAQAEFETKFGANQKAALNKQLNEKNKALQIQKWLAIIAAVILLASGLLLIRANKKNKRINTILLSEKNVIEKQAAEKIVLVKEIHHRVKNNLTLLKSLLYLQSKAAKENETKQILNDVQVRIQSMALVHQNLFDGINDTELNIKQFISELLLELTNSYFSTGKIVDTEVVGEEKSIDIERAIPLSLIVNELATNSFKYAFTNTNRGAIQASIANSIDEIKITYTDTGAGLQDDFDITKGGFGFKVIKILAQQLKATLKYEKSTNSFEITIPNK